MGSGTDALVVALLALGLKPGDEVVCPAFTFIAAAEAVLLLGGRPVFAEVEEAGAMVTRESVEAALTEKTVGIVPVDLYGQCGPLEELGALAVERGLWMIEDAAQSLGAARNGKMAGAFGNIAITSFYPAKPLGCMGDGGMAFTDDQALAAKMRELRVHGDASSYEHVSLGLNARLDTLQAAVLLAKLSFFEEEVRLRNEAARVYGEFWAASPGWGFPRCCPATPRSGPNTPSAPSVGPSSRPIFGRGTCPPRSIIPNPCTSSPSSRTWAWAGKVSHGRAAERPGPLPAHAPLPDPGAAGAGGRPHRRIHEKGAGCLVPPGKGTARAAPRPGWPAIRFG